MPCQLLAYASHGSGASLAPDVVQIRSVSLGSPTPRQLPLGPLHGVEMGPESSRALLRLAPQSLELPRPSAAVPRAREEGKRAAGSAPARGVHSPATCRFLAPAESPVCPGLLKPAWKE